MSNGIVEYEENNQLARAETAGPLGAVKIESGVHTAMRVQLPRDLIEFEKRVLFEAKRLGKHAVYSWKQGGKIVEGPTIKLAMSLYRNFSNAMISVRLLEQTDDYFLVEAVFVDLETGTNFPAVHMEPREKNSRMGEGRQNMIDLGKAQSKAKRNAIIDGMPYHVVDAAMTVAKNASQKNISKGNGDVLQRLIEKFSHHKVTRSMIENQIGIKLEEASTAQIWQLRSIYEALNEGLTTVENEFPNYPKQQTQVEQVEDDDMRDFDLTLENVTNEK